MRTFAQKQSPPQQVPALNRTGQAAGERAHSQRSEANNARENVALPITHEVLPSPGQPLDPATRDTMEMRFKHDFTRVRVHADDGAETAAHAIGANAFTLGHHLYFAAGRYEPATPRGVRLLAHELAHVMQQARTGVRFPLEGRGLLPADLAMLPRTRASEPAEREAARAASVFAAGGAPRVTLATPALVARDEVGAEAAPAQSAPHQQVIDALDRPQEHGVGDYPEAFRILKSLDMTALLAVLAALGRRAMLDLLTTNISAALADRDRIEVGIAAVKLRASQTAPVPKARTSELGPAFGTLPQGDQDAVNALLAGPAIAMSIAPPTPPPPPPVNLSTTGADAFEPGILPALDAQKNPKWVETDIAGDQLSDKAPWTYTLTYKDGSQLVIPLEQVFMERLPTGTITLFRKQKASGRIVPCVIAASDPRLRALKGQPSANYSAIADLATPRFDSNTAPKIVSLVNAAQMLFLGKGMLEVLQLQAMNPIMGGGASAAGKVGGRVAGGAAKKLAGAVAEESFTFVEIGAGDLKASIELAKKGGVKVIAVDPAVPAVAAVKELQGAGGQFVKGVAADLAPSTADHVFQYFPWRITGTGRLLEGGTWRLVEDTVRLLKPNGAAHFVTEDLATAKFLADEATKRGLRAVITDTTAGAAAAGASGAGVPGFSKALGVWMVNIYK
jgi:Domain of unknown function (DUF4157)